SGTRSRLAFVAAPDAPDGDRIFLGVDADGPYFAVLGALPEVPNARPASLREVGEVLDDHHAALLAEAVGVANWHRSYRYSPATGAPLVWQAAGWEGVPADDSAVVWPRTNPAVIVLVHDGVPGEGGRCLLTRAASWEPGRYSCVAGFVEPGESAEAAVGREVREETAVLVRDVRYVASQPWPLPASLMLGFYALADAGQEVVVDHTELEDARWFTRAELRGRGPGPAPLHPSAFSISHELIVGWRDAD
ncbi:MAG TPA: NAD(+) diphosphatase, partial [Cryptosporangiaceae bacterium]|nr:NAD(+) diphosphatase [Cryptosporangiaceae bacterium]